MQFLKLLLGFSPWLAFLFIVHGSLFRLKVGLAWHKMVLHSLPDWGYEVISYTLMLSCAILSSWYPAHLKRQRAAQTAAQ